MYKVMLVTQKDRGFLRIAVVPTEQYEAIKSSNKDKFSFDKELITESNAQNAMKRAQRFATEIPKLKNPDTTAKMPIITFKG